MKTLKRYTFQIAALSVLTPLMMAGVRTAHVADKKQAQPELPVLNWEAQAAHANELVAGRSIASVSNRDDARKMSRKILEIVKKSLPKESRSRAFEIARTVVIEANHHKMDPFFLLAVIKTESSFRINARGRHGEIGLMQLMPATAKWLAPQAGISPENLDLENPAINIRLGATYLSSLRKSFEGVGNRYIAAYNMGSKNVRKLVANEVEPAIYPGKVLKNYTSLKSQAVKIGANVKPAAKS